MMRIRLLVPAILCVLFIQMKISAQFDYFANDPIWRYGAYSNPGGIPNYIVYETLNHYIAGDTNISGLDYKKLRIRSIGWTIPASVYTSYDQLFGHVRQAGHRIYLLQDGMYTDQLLFDLSLQVGDTVPPSYYTSGQNAIVMGRDTIELAGIARIRLNIAFAGSEEDQLIEGMGSTTEGLGWYGIGLGFDQHLECFGYGDQSYYPEEGFNCDIGLSSEEHSERTGVIVHPNPATTSVTIQLATPADDVWLTNMTGQPLARWSFRNTTSIALDLMDVPAGIHLLRIRMNDSNVISRKLIVQ